MSSDEIVIDVRRLSKLYEIYETPRDRLKQFLLPSLGRATGRIARALGVKKPHIPPRYFREFWALRDISFQVRRGETVGIIGRNGSGKSTLLQIIAGTLASTSGEVLVNGRVAALLELGSGFNPEFSGRENVFLSGQILGLSQKEIETCYDQIVEFADIGDFIDQPVKMYSSGMFLRLAFAVHAHVDASIVIIDEALAVGDIFFRQKCYARLEKLRDAGAAVLLVSHSMPDIEQYCRRALLLDQGKQVFIGSSQEAAKHYYILHQSPVSQPDKVTLKNPVPDEKPAERGVSRPLSGALVDLTKKTQVSNGKAKCLCVSVSNKNNQPCNNFHQGDTAIFYYEFEISEYIGVPICGLLITNDKGVIVYGKNSWQYNDETSRLDASGHLVVCQHELCLQLAPGEYTFELGLASVSQLDWDRRRSMPHEEWNGCYVTNCVVCNAGRFSVGLALRNGITVLSHHGVADLPGRIIVETVR